MRVMLMVWMVVTGCARDVHVCYPAEPDEPTGTLVLLLSKPASDVNVSINGRLVVEDAHTRRVVVASAPIGSPEIVVTANGGDRQLRPWVGTEHATVIPLAVPDASAGFVKTLVGSLLSIVVYSLLR